MVQVAKALAPLLRETFPSLSPRLLDAQVRAMVRSIERPNGGGAWDVGVMLTSDAHMQQLNRKFRQKDKPTDILSFPFHKVSASMRAVCVCSWHSARSLASVLNELAHACRSQGPAAFRAWRRARSATWGTSTSAPRTCSGSASAASWTTTRRSRRACPCCSRTASATC